MRIGRTHEYSAPLVPPIFSAATLETLMKAPMTSSPLIEPTRRRASKAESTVGMIALRYYLMTSHTACTRLQRQATITVTRNSVHSSDLCLGPVQRVACPLHGVGKLFCALRAHFPCVVHSTLGGENSRCQWRRKLRWGYMRCPFPARGVSAHVKEGKYNFLWRWISSGEYST